MVLKKAANLLKSASSVLICTGAGMSAECGIPTFRDKEGFWNEFPIYAQQGINAIELANLHGFKTNPKRAWGFYEWRRKTVSLANIHQGYYALNEWIKKFENIFIHTTNTDSIHEKAGWPDELIREPHGSLWKMQCLGGCHINTWPNQEVPLCGINEDMIAENLPQCSRCGNIARPNILMFGDNEYQDDIQQYMKFQEFMLKTPPEVIILIGSSGEVGTNENLILRWKMQKKEKRHVISINPDTHPDFSDIKVFGKAEESICALTELL